MNMLKISSLYVVTAGLLSGCVATEAQNNAHVDFVLKTAARVCEGEGFVPKTDEYRQCMERRIRGEEERNNAIAAAAPSRVNLHVCRPASGFAGGFANGLNGC